jgi:hypothetical protein
MIIAYLSRPGEASVRAATLTTTLSGPLFKGAAVKNLWQCPFFIFAFFYKANKNRVTMLTRSIKKRWCR